MTNKQRLAAYYEQLDAMIRAFFKNQCDFARLLGMQDKIYKLERKASK